MIRHAWIILLVASTSYGASIPIPSNRTKEDYWRYASDVGVIGHVGDEIWFDGFRIFWPDRLTPPTSLAQTDYSASPTNSVVWYSNRVAEIKGQMAEVDPMLKAAILGLMDAFNSKLPATNRITATQLKNAIKGRLE